ncbi:MAG TPA: CHAP domain-containing protein [Actinocrinis sp.]|nr:CHAP domain-containing protein [Actinocrinis sp.]
MKTEKVRRKTRKRLRTLLLAMSLVLGGLTGVVVSAGAAHADTSLCGGVNYTSCTSATPSRTDHGYGEAADWSTHMYWTMYAGHNCTNYVAYMAIQNGAATPSVNLGSAADWATNAAKSTTKIPVNSTPATGAIAQWNAGHVAYVESVAYNSGGTVSSITVSEDNFPGGVYPNGWFDWRTITPAGDWPSNFIHFADLSSSGSTPTSYKVAFQANNGSLYLYNPTSGATDTTLGVMTGTSPAIAPLKDGSYEAAFQAANTGSFYLYNTSSGGTNLSLGMASGTSPAVTPLTGGGYEAAFQDNTGNLWVYGSAGTHDLGLGMATETSPSIGGLSNGSYEVAFQANTGSLYLYSPSSGATSLALGMATGTSPSIAGLSSGGYELSFQDNTGNLWVYGSAGTHDLGLGMASGTSPSTAGLSNGTYKVAFQASGSGSLYLYDPASGATDTTLGIAVGTSPSIYGAGDGYELSFQDNADNLWVYGSASIADTMLGVKSGTSPAMG